ncbi:hypothetical protein SAM19_02402 [Brevibacillus laterosporus]|nr:hypothetical protein [Brevibacillus laterosporus]
MHNKTTIRFTYLEAYLNELTTKGNYDKESLESRKSCACRLGFRTKQQLMYYQKMVDAV